MKIILLSAEPNNFVPVELAKNATELGHEVIVVDITKTVLIEQTTTTNKKSKVMFQECCDKDDKSEPKVLVLEPPFSCIPRLNEHDLEYKLGVLRNLELQGVTMLNSAESMSLCNDKLGSQVVLNKAGLKTPWSMAIGSLDMLEPSLVIAEADGDLKFPMIIKTLRGTHGIGVMKVDSRSSLVSVAQAVMAQDMQVMLQEFIKHDKSARLIMIGDQMLAANLRMQPKEKDEFRTNSHLGSETKKYEPSEAEMEMGRKIVELFGCKFCAIDYIMVDDQIIVLEVNGSPGLEAIQKDWEGERNLAKMVIEYLVKDEPKPEVAPDPASVPYVEPVQPVKVQSISGIEKIKFIRLSDEDIEARVDTGAGYSSLHVDKYEDLDEWLNITRGDVTYKIPVDRHIKINNAHGQDRRPIIKLDVIFMGQRFNEVEFTITDRSDLKYEALIGRNLLELTGMPIIIQAKDIQNQEEE